MLAGRDRGERMRTKAEVDKLDAADAEVRVVIPTRLWSVNTSFFLGLFANSIVQLGADGFRAKYKFEGKDIRSLMDTSIRVAVNEQQPLALMSTSRDR